MNFAIYAAIAAVLTIFFICSYIKQRRPFQLAFALWVPSTLLQYMSSSRTFFNILSVVEILAFLVVLFLLWKDQRDRKKAEEETEE